jgi:transcriptional regulator NrdR family protein
MDPITIFECPRCKYSSIHAHALKRHLQRKNVCSPAYSDMDRNECYKASFPNELTINERRTILCSDCGKTFTTIQARSRHKHTCSRKNKDRQADDVLIQAIADKVIGTLQQDGKTSFTIQNITNTISQTINNTTHINVNAFGNEDLSHVMKHHLHTAVKRRDKGMLELVQHMHFNESVPQNHNLRVTNLKLPYIQYHDGKQWMLGKKDKILDALIENGHSLMQEHFEEYQDEFKRNYSQTMFDLIKGFLEGVSDRDKKVVGPILEDLYILIYNKSKSII